MRVLHSDDFYDYVLLNERYSGFFVDQTFAIISKDTLVIRHRDSGSDRDIILSHAEVGELLELLSAYKRRREVASAPELTEGK